MLAHATLWEAVYFVVALVGSVASTWCLTEAVRSHLFALNHPYRRRIDQYFSLMLSWMVIRTELTHTFVQLFLATLGGFAIFAAPPTSMANLEVARAFGSFIATFALTLNSIDRLRVRRRIGADDLC